ncbi:hypothetical protein M569_03546, partial [Genlisea aurea]
DDKNSQFPDYSIHTDAAKLSGREIDLNEKHKKKDVFRPSVLDMESGGRERWRDEERDSNFSVRKDQWREGDKEYSDTRRLDRKVDSSLRLHGEMRRTPGERWVDTGNKDNHDQRRERKWNSRWGHSEKEDAPVYEKWGSAIKEDEVNPDKVSNRLPFHGKDERDGDRHRPWRPSSLYGRGRSEANQHNSAPSKHSPTYSHGLGRGENSSANFPLGRGRFNSGDSSVNSPLIPMQSRGHVVEKGESDTVLPYPLSYSRTKLIDIFRATDILSHKKYIENAVQVPSLTQETLVEPLAFFTPTTEELAILKEIDRGEISGASQNIK